MKKLLLTMLTAGCGLVVWSQTNTPAAKSSERNIGLGADHLFFSGSESRQLIYSGHVWVTNVQGSLTCGQLTLDLPPQNSADSRPTNVTALTNVVINYVKDGKTNHITCDKMVNVYRVVDSVTNDTFTFSGHARMSNSKGWMTGEPLIYDNVSGQFTGTGIESQFAVPTSSGNGTNAGTNGVVSPLSVFK